MEDEIEFCYTKSGLFYIIGYKNMKSNKFYGDIIFCLNSNGDIYGRGFCVNSLLFGIVKMYSGIGLPMTNEFYSIFNPGNKIDEFEYKKELYSIRTGEREEPEHFKWSDKTLPDNWLELFKEKLDIDLKERTLLLKLGGKNKGFTIND